MKKQTRAEEKQYQKFDSAFESYKKKEEKPKTKVVVLSQI